MRGPAMSRIPKTRTDLVTELGERFCKVFGDRLLMVTKNRDVSVGRVVRRDLFCDRAVRRRQLAELLLECPRGIVGTEDFGRKSLHLGLKIVVQQRGLVVSPIT